MVQKTLQVAGDQDIHGRRSRLVEGAAGIIGTGLDEVGQDVILVGSANQLAHRQAHLLGIITGQDIAKVSGRHAEVHRLSPGNIALLHQAEVGIEVVHDLRHQATPVDGVCAGQADIALFQFFSNRSIAKHAFHAGLGIVKVAVHGIDGYVISCLGGHLQALDFAGTGIGIEHFDLNARQACITSQCSLAGIAGGCHQNAGRFGAAQVFFGLNQQFGHQLERIVLEGAGRAVPQFQRVQAIVNLLDITRLTGKGISISCSGSFTQESRVIICQKASQNFLGKFRVAEGFPIFQLCLGERGGNEQAAVRCQTAENGLRRRNDGVGIACALELHNQTPYIFFISIKPFRTERPVFSGTAKIGCTSCFAVSKTAQNRPRIIRWQKHPGCSGPASRNRQAKLPPHQNGCWHQHTGFAEDTGLPRQSDVAVYNSPPLRPGRRAGRWCGSALYKIKSSSPMRVR